MLVREKSPANKGSRNLVIRNKFYKQREFSAFLAIETRCFSKISLTRVVFIAVQRTNEQDESKNVPTNIHAYVSDRSSRNFSEFSSKRKKRRKRDYSELRRERKGRKDEYI